MLCFDKLKMVTSLEYINDIDMKCFTAQYRGDELVSCSYKGKVPSLMIKVDYEKNELVMEFTSKILGDDSIQLINGDNIKQCLDRVNGLGICLLDTGNILANSSVVKCDVTRDIVYPDVSLIQGYMATHVKNCRKWTCENYRGNVVLRKVVQTDRYKKRLVVYDKSKELGNSKNKAFLDSLFDKDKLMEYYKGKVRFELNLTTREGIRKGLGIESTALNEVLNSTSNPLLALLDEALDFSETVAPGTLSLNDYKCKCVLEVNGYDLARVEETFRGLISPKTPVSQVMKPYRDLLNRLQAGASKITPFRELVA